MKLVFQHPTGNANVRAALSGLENAGVLESFHTSIACFPGSKLDRLARISMFSEFRRRAYSASLESLTRTYPWKEGGRMISTKTGMFNLVKHEKGVFCIDAVYRNLDRRVANYITEKKDAIDVVYAYEDGALHSFKEAKRSGLTCFYDLPIGYWREARRLLLDEREKWPDWVATLTGFQDSEEKLERKDAELMLADKILVASSFTAKTLNSYAGKLAPVEVIPYGFPPVNPKENYSANSQKKPLKVLFVGGLSQRKGIANLFAAVDSLQKHISLTVVGRKGKNSCPALDSNLARHTWIPSLAHDKILALMKSHDVFVFPSLFEGFGLVITEAMSQGTPVITTERTVGPDIIKNDENGWLIEAGSTSALKACLEDLLVNPVKIGRAGRAALETARQRPWEVYGQELAQAILRTQKLAEVY
ncbi:glycosyltransferase family 4 protein [Zunongwangia sp. F260]|uniref:Glycosyltransferase family 4 protein n=1 Tax=Autumnicola lenta TaxID=3075593 RepID=A0ABU3CIT6_9FLAO|nr:glycosyltransferase family 4 protein [Zunongwangia sp. F260]MDT0646267.1 glycosyltransferase family 4 protein [Zunongwangia sp. F260]